MLEKKQLLFKELLDSRGKYTYFLLAVSASAIAFCAQITSERIFSYSLIPLGIAVLCWGTSFFYGCRFLQSSHNALVANMNYIDICVGNHLEIGNDPAKIKEAKSESDKKLERRAMQARKFLKYQFWFIVSGGAGFLIWHLIEMGLRSLVVG